MISKAIAWILARPQVFLWLLSYCARVVGVHQIGSLSCWVLFNGPRFCKWLPKISLQHTLHAERCIHLHSHPYIFHMFVLSGSYREATLDGENVYRAGDAVFYPRVGFHRIIDVTPGGFYALLIIYGREMPWGYVVGDQYVGHFTYNEYRKEKLL